MAKIVHLRDKTDPPAEQRPYFLVECVPALQGTELIKHTDGETIRIRTDEYEAQVAAIKARFSDSPDTIIYVRGAPNAQRP